MIFLSRFGDRFGLMFRLVVFGHHPSLSKMIEIASTLIIPLFLNAAASNGSKVGTCHTCFGTRFFFLSSKQMSTSIKIINTYLD